MSYIDVDVFCLVQEAVLALEDRMMVLRTRNSQLHKASSKAHELQNQAQMQVCSAATNLLLFAKYRSGDLRGA